MRKRLALDSCPSCDGFVPPRAAVCPHCGQQKSAVGKWARRAAVAVAGAGFGVTLMACYGPPPREYDKVPATPATNAGDASKPTGDAATPK